MSRLGAKQAGGLHSADCLLLAQMERSLTDDLRQHGNRGHVDTCATRRRRSPQKSRLLATTTMNPQNARYVAEVRGARGGDAECHPSIAQTAGELTSRPALDSPTPWGDTADQLDRTASEGDQSMATAPSEFDNRLSPRPSALAGHAPRRMQTDAENAREKKLREDHLVYIYNPQLVQCRRCGAKIKLSLKSSWDPFHWTKHRARCLKRPDDVVKALKAGTEKPSSHSRASPPAKTAKLVTPRISSRKRRDSEPTLTPPPLTPCSSLSSYGADDSFSDHDTTPSSPIAPVRDVRMSTTAFSEKGHPRTWLGSASRASASRSHTRPPCHNSDQRVRHPSLDIDPNSSHQYQRRSPHPHQPSSSAPRCLYPRLLIPDPDDDVYMEDWTAEAWRPIMFQESKVRFSLS